MFGSQLYFHPQVTNSGKCAYSGWCLRRNCSHPSVQWLRVALCPGSNRVCAFSTPGWKQSRISNTVLQILLDNGQSQKEECFWIALLFCFALLCPTRTYTWISAQLFFHHPPEKHWHIIHQDHKATVVSTHDLKLH